MNANTAASLLEKVNRCKKEWQQDLFMEHGGKFINVSCAAMGKYAVTPIGAIDQPLQYPSGSVYRLDTRFFGPEACELVKEMLRQPQCCPGCKLILNTKSRPSSAIRAKTINFVCSQYRGASVNTLSFKEGKLAQTNIKCPTMKIQKTKGTSNSGITQMAPKSQRQHISELASTDNIMASKRKFRRTSSNKTSLPCGMQVIIFLSPVDNYYYLSTGSELMHSNHFELPSDCIPQNELNLKSNELELMSTMFNAHVPRTTIARVMCQLKGKHDTHLNPKTLANIQNKTNLIINHQTLGDVAAMNEADKTLAKLKE